MHYNAQQSTGTSARKAEGKRAKIYWTCEQRRKIPNEVTAKRPPPRLPSANAVLKKPNEPSHCIWAQLRNLEEMIAESRDLL